MVKPHTEDMMLYKFRSLQNLRRFLDILVKKRLYMAHYNEMNDPMEGAFLLEESKKHLLNDIWSGKYKKLICCFSTDYRHTLLWSHYADSHQGCCLEVKVTSKLAPCEVHYSQKIPKTDKCDITKILTHKSDYWKYENEIRFFKDELTTKGKKVILIYPLKLKKFC